MMDQDTYNCAFCGDEVWEGTRKPHNHYEEVHRPRNESWGMSPCCFPNMPWEEALELIEDVKESERGAKW